MKITFTQPGRGKPKTILLNGEAVGGISRVKGIGAYSDTWQGAVTNRSGEQWNIIELTLKQVEKRVMEAFNIERQT
jgi:hypothetical protein